MLWARKAGKSRATAIFAGSMGRVKKVCLLVPNDRSKREMIKAIYDIHGSYPIFLKILTPEDTK